MANFFRCGPADISATVKAYFALKLAGVASDEPVMLRAKDLILQKGGVAQANVFTKTILVVISANMIGAGFLACPRKYSLLRNGFILISMRCRIGRARYYYPSAHSDFCPPASLLLFRKNKVSTNSILKPLDGVDFSQVPPLHRDSTFLSWRNFFVWVDSLLRLYEFYPNQIPQEESPERG